MSQDATASDGRGRIVILGDSITAGYGLDVSEAYPALLQQQITSEGLAYEVVNAGISGDTSSGGLSRVEWALQDGAEILVVALGGNDGLRGVSPDVTADNLKQIITKAQKLQPELKVLLAGMRMPGSMGKEYVEKYDAIFARVADETGSARYPFLLEGLAGDPKLNLADLIHPNAAGQKIIAAGMWRALKPMLERN